MIYLKNDKTLFQEIWIPRQEFDYTSVSPYEKGYEDGMAAQKAKLVSTAITENGTVEKADGFSSVTVTVVPNLISKPVDVTGDTMTVYTNSRPTVWDKTVYGGSIEAFEAFIDENPRVDIMAWMDGEHSDSIQLGWFEKRDGEYGWWNYQSDEFYPFSSFTCSWQNVMNCFMMLCDGKNFFFYDSSDNGIFCRFEPYTLDDFIFTVDNPDGMSAVTVDATVFADVKYTEGYNNAFGIVKRDAIELTFTENGTWEADPDFFNHIFAKKVVVDCNNDFFRIFNRTASAGTVTLTAHNSGKIKTSTDKVNWTEHTTQGWSTPLTFTIPAFGYLYFNNSNLDNPIGEASIEADVAYDVFGSISTVIDKERISPSLDFRTNTNNNLVNANGLVIDLPISLAETFMNCTNLISAPSILPALNMHKEFYEDMFHGCTSLTVGSILPATTLAEEAYKDMFQGCLNLKSITIMATDISAPRCVSNMLPANPVEGATIYCPASMVSTWQQLYPNWTVQAIS